MAAGAMMCLLAFYSQQALGGDSESGTLVLYEDACSPLCLTYINEQSDIGLNGSPGLQLTPDPWHCPVYWLYRGGGQREDFSPFDVVEFYFRSLASDPGDPSFYLKTWNNASNVVSIADYIEENIIDDQWRLVSIPLAQLKTEEWDLGNVESLNWEKDSENRVYYVDNIVLRTVIPPGLLTTGEDAPFPESERVMRLRFSKRYENQVALTKAHYTIVSQTDPAYQDPVYPLDTGIHYRLKDFTGSGSAMNRYQVFLNFPEPFQNGHAYTLTVQGVSDISGNLMTDASFTFTYNDTLLLNPNIKVNQIGYRLDHPKIGYVGGYLGDLGGGVWAVGENGALFSRDKQTGWTEMESPVTETLRGVAAIREDRAWAVGDRGTIIKWDGKTWEPVQAPTIEDLLAVCFGPTNIGWAVGRGGTSLRLVDDTWTLVSTPTVHALRAVWAGPDDTAWAVGDGGTILRWDGQQWQPDEQPSQSDLYAVQGPHKDWLWACGADGTVLQYRYNHWNIFEDTPGTPKILRSIASDDNGGVWIAGEEGILLHKPGFGSSAFAAENSGTTNTIHALARQHGRQSWGVGEDGLLISGTSEGWVQDAGLGDNSLYGVFALAAGPLRLPEPPPEAAVIDSDTGEVVLHAPLKLRAANWAMSGEDVYAFDFSSLKTAGTYQVHIAGIGLSDPFVIDDDAFNHAAYTAARGLYYQRSGTALVYPFAEDRFTRPISHEYDPEGRRIDAMVHSSLPETPLYSGETVNEMTDAHGGWHDAGDYGKYVPTAAAALWFLFTAYDMDPSRFKDGAWNIPESGNGWPDVLDEAAWEVDWIARIQGDEGAVHHKLTSEKWFDGMPHEETGSRFLFEKTTHDTALAAAVFACAGRLWETFDPQVAKTYLKRAESAWRFLLKHPDPAPSEGFKNPEGTVTGEYNDADDSDNRLWAAAELYRTTGKKQYREYFENWWANNDHTSGWNKWQHFYGPAYWAYLRSSHTGADEEIKAAIRNLILRDADQMVTRTWLNPYLNGARLDVPDQIGWGAFTQSVEYAFPLLQAWTLTAQKKYLDAAALNLDAQLGANPLSFSFITGLGKRYPKDPLHKVSFHDGVDEPIPGIPVFGVFAHMSNGQPYYLAAQSDENSYPYSYATTDPYPILRRYIDAHELVPMSEFTIVDMAIAAGVFHLLSGNASLHSD